MDLPFSLQTSAGVLPRPPGTKDVVRHGHFEVMVVEGLPTLLGPHKGDVYFLEDRVGGSPVAELAPARDRGQTNVLHGAAEKPDPLDVLVELEALLQDHDGNVVVQRGPPV